MDDMFVITLILAAFGYGAFLGWWARGLAIDGERRLWNALKKISAGEIRFTHHDEDNCTVEVIHDEDVEAGRRDA